MLATVISPLGAAVFYFAIAVPLAIVAARYARMPSLAAGIVSAIVLALMTMLREQLPFDFLYYANDFILEPLIYDRNIVSAIATLSFHLGPPVLIGRWIRQQLDQRRHAANGFEVLPIVPQPTDPEIGPYYDLSLVMGCCVFCRDCKRESMFTSLHPEFSTQYHSDHAITMHREGWMLLAAESEVLCPECAKMLSR